MNNDDHDFHDRIIRDAIAREGGYVDHPADRGGPTNYGITLKTARAVSGDPKFTKEALAQMTEDDAAEIYKRLYMAPFAALSAFAVFNRPDIMKFLFNAAVQHGSSGAIKMLQQALGDVEVDGVLGPKTQRAINLSPLDAVDAFFVRLISARAMYYSEILRHNQSQRVFAAGWFRRLAEDLL